MLVYLIPSNKAADTIFDRDSDDAFVCLLICAFPNLQVRICRYLIPYESQSEFVALYEPERGYEESTWEPADRFRQDVPEMVEKFEKARTRD